MQRLLLFVAALFFAPMIALAHEVYVLEPQVVDKDLSMPSLQVFSIITAHAGSFFFWAFIGLWAILTVFSIRISKGLEAGLDPILAVLRKYAPLAARLTLGIAITASGYFGAMFGPELPLADFLSPAGAHIAQVLLIVTGTLITAGLLTRLASMLLILFYLGMWSHYGFYMLTYVNYFGEMILTLILGNSTFALDRYFHHLYPHTIHRLVNWMERHAFVILRGAFGISLIFASMYAKFLHAQLAIDTVITYHLTDYFPFEPSFIVLGAFCIELLAGLFFLFGIEIRFASLFLLFWLTLSLLYFGEAVWPHIVLAGTAIAIFMHGYDKYTLEWSLMRRRNKHARAPML
ncbi:hypothetical protein A2765_01145 [Candidatus Kaiserbacteria bacterium RIFCSPHIGHO2_01_FULL_56_24]|uniref:DoxX family protein n=1 Tax=Candidatus Kaiserbacteria bacterium RIFCSPHIGHO2_01_FULL_56_24 TaxID=1798487 RepID=A0A1F6DFE9_9BACT|nr:MAG: hypothetical protein A2765_01145 [Candidatus Kaiserbacteria bacterium RIFCSPHIGHO2_01_FULL_56_24]